MRAHFDPIRWLQVLRGDPVPLLIVLLIGAIGSFVYSYVPLHGGKDWKIDYLQTRVDEQNLKLRELEGSLADTQADAENRPESGEFDALRKDLGQAERERDQLKGKLERSERTVTSLRKTRDQWKQKFEDLLADTHEPAAPPPVANEAAPSAGEGAAETPPSQAPAALTP